MLGAVGLQGSHQTSNTVTLLWVFSQVSPVCNSSYHSFSTFLGGFLQSPLGIGCIYSSTAKDFISKKSNKKKEHSNAHLNKARCHYATHLLCTFPLSLGITCRSSARAINLPQKANSTIAKEPEITKISHILACEKSRVRPLHKKTIMESAQTKKNIIKTQKNPAKIETTQVYFTKWIPMLREQKGRWAQVPSRPTFVSLRDWWKPSVLIPPSSNEVTVCVQSEVACSLTKSC